MNQVLLLDLADSIFPGYGFFGGADPFALNIAINRTVDQVVLSVRAPHPEFLNIEAVEFHAPDGGIYDRSEIIKSVLMSSIYDNLPLDECFQQVINGSLVHTEREDEPSIRISFHEATSLGRIVVRNRTDIYGHRSTFLSCTVEANGTSFLCLENSSEATKVAALDRISSFAGVEIDIKSTTDILDTANRIRMAVLANLELGGDDFEFLELCRFLPLYNVSPTLTEFQRTVCATIALKLLGDCDLIPLKLIEPIQTVLGSTEALELVQREASRLMSLWSSSQSKVIFSKHGFHRSVLLEQKEEYLEAMDEAVQLFNDFGVTLMLCYGSLLGAIRDKSFIPHDDDVDFLIYDGSLSREEAIRRSKKIIDSLSDRGYEIWREEAGNFNVSFNGRALDFFICWLEANKIVLMMENFAYRSINHAIVYPPSEVVLYERTLKAPAKPEAFLEERYGSDWRVPNQFHEWRWKLEK
jgi:hypothetical protein